MQRNIFVQSGDVTDERDRGRLRYGDAHGQIRVNEWKSEVGLNTVPVPTAKSVVGRGSQHRRVYPEIALYIKRGAIQAV
jgi:hypothetical protein